MRTAGNAVFIDDIVRSGEFCGRTQWYIGFFKNPWGSIWIITKRITGKQCFINFDAVKCGITKKGFRIDQRMFPKEIFQ